MLFIQNADGEHAPPKMTVLKRGSRIDGANRQFKTLRS